MADGVREVLSDMQKATWVDADSRDAFNLRWSVIAFAPFTFYLRTAALGLRPEHLTSFQMRTQPHGVVLGYIDALMQSQNSFPLPRAFSVFLVSSVFVFENRIAS